MSKTGCLITSMDKAVDKGLDYNIEVTFVNNSGSQASSSTDIRLSTDLPSKTVNFTDVPDGDEAVKTVSLSTNTADYGLYKPLLEGNVVDYANVDSYNEGGHVGLDRLLQAVDDWRNNLISTTTLTATVNSWRKPDQALIERARVYDIISVDGPSGVNVGDLLKWTVQAERVGDLDVAQGVRVSVGNDLSVETGNIDLEKGETGTIEVSAIATEDLVGSNSWEVKIGPDSYSGNVSVYSLPEPDIRLTIDSINTPDVNGDLIVNGHIENDTDNPIFSETIRLTVSGDVVSTTYKNIEAQEQEDFEFNIDLSTYSFPVGENLLQVDSVDTAGVVRSGTVQITADPSYSILSVNGPSDGVKGDIFTWEVDIQNDGLGFDTKSLRLEVGSQTVRAESVEILPGDSRTFSIDFAVKTIGDVSWTVSIDDATSSGTVNVSDSPEPNLRISINSINQPTQGEDLVVNASVTNERNTSASDFIQLLLPTTTQSVDDEVQVNIGPNGDENVELRFTTTEDEVGTLSFQVITRDEPVVRNIFTEVGGIPEYTITNVEYPSEAKSGSFVNFDVTLENIGTSTDQRFISLNWQDTGDVDDKEQPVSVPEGQTKQKRFNFRIPLKRGTFDFTISTDVDSFTGTIDVSFSPVVTLEANDVTFERATFSGDIIVSGDSENYTVGFQLRESDSQDASPQKIISQQNTNSEEEFTAEFEGLLPETDYEFRAFFDTAERTFYGDYVTFTTEPLGPVFDLQIQNISDSVEELDIFGLQVSLNNKGLSATTEVVLLVDGTVEDSRTVDIGEYEEKNTTLIWDTDIGDAGFVEVKSETRNTQFEA